MLTRCQLSSLLSKSASTSQRISKPPRRRPSSLFEVGSSVRWFSKGTHTSSETKKKLSDSPSEIEWPLNESWGFEDLDDGEPENNYEEPREQADESQYPETALLNSDVMPSFRSSQPYIKRQSLSQRERATLKEMVDSILKPHKQKEENYIPTSFKSREVRDLVLRLRQYEKKPKMANQVHEQLDKKLEEIGLCTTDLQLLEWATKNVFEGFETARSGGIEFPLYPKLVAHLMRTFRVQYQDPHLALSIFDYAKNLSTMSFVFGCSTDSYNELLETHWILSHNLEVIHASVEEMVRNGVPPNAKTRRLVETFRQEVSEGSHDRNMDILIKIERLITVSRFKKANPYEEWKSGLTNLDDTQMFDNWQPQRNGERFKFQDRPNGRKLRREEDRFQF